MHEYSPHGKIIFVPAPFGIWRRDFVFGVSQNLAERPRTGNHATFQCEQHLIARRPPQGLKPASFEFNGTAEAVPFPGLIGARIEALLFEPE